MFCFFWSCFPCKFVSHPICIPTFSIVTGLCHLTPLRLLIGHLPFFFSSRDKAGAINKQRQGQLEFEEGEGVGWGGVSIPSSLPRFPRCLCNHGGADIKPVRLPQCWDLPANQQPPAERGVSQTRAQSLWRSLAPSTLSSRSLRVS